MEYNVWSGTKWKRTGVGAKMSDQSGNDGGIHTVFRRNGWAAAAGVMEHKKQEGTTTITIGFVDEQRENGRMNERMKGLRLRANAGENSGSSRRWGNDQNGWWENEMGGEKGGRRKCEWFFSPFGFLNKALAAFLRYLNPMRIRGDRF